MPKKRALRRFWQACGLGKVEKSSGRVDRSQRGRELDRVRQHPQ
ncbi:hypothetical protein [Microcoleus sp. herbarium14]